MTERELALFIENPRWADCVEDLKPGGPTCRLVAHEDCTPLDVDAVEGHLRPGGTLGSIPGYEARPGQLDMTRAVTRAFNGREHLVIEAGTGVGKSLAYLVPAVQWAAANGTPVIISTATRNLQSQLIAQDIPRAVQTLEEPWNFRAAVLKGRANYLCLNALGEYFNEGFFVFSEEEKRELAATVEWLQKTKDGDLDTLDVSLKPKIFSDGEDCGGRRCPFYGKCFVRKAREKAARAHLVVANHALVLAEATGSGGGLLPAYGRVIFDEAHDLADIATEFFSFEFSRKTLNQLLGRVTRSSRRKRVTRAKGLLGIVERQLNKGALAQYGNAAETVRELSAKARVEAKYAAMAGEAVFDELRHLFAPAPDAESIRYRRPKAGMLRTEEGEPVYGDNGRPGVRQYSRNGMFADYTAAQWNELLLETALLKLEHHLACLADLLMDLGNALTAACEGELPLFGDIAAQAYTLAGTFRDYLLEAKFTIAGAEETHVFWAEKESVSPGRKAGPGAWSVRLTAAPLSVAKELRACFWDVKDSVVLASATLRVGDRFDYMARKLGAAGGASSSDPDDASNRTRFLTAASPFDYFRQVCAVSTDFLPDPATEAGKYAERLALFLGDLFRITRGRALVLFTAYDMMRRVAGAAREPFDAAGIELLVQGEGLTREAMVARLKAADGSSPAVLFGAQSFWEGVDVPGEALSCVVIARLPFPQVGEPIVEARCEKIKEAGGTPFRDYMIPEAVIAFKQGFGRLVRTRGDRGAVIVADSRIATKNYGTIFRRAVPVTVRTVSTAEDALSRVSVFFAENGDPGPEAVRAEDAGGQAVAGRG